jgi:hypothetical protein
MPWTLRPGCARRSRPSLRRRANSASCPQARRAGVVRAGPSARRVQREAGADAGRAGSRPGRDRRTCLAWKGVARCLAHLGHPRRQQGGAGALGIAGLGAGPARDRCPQPGSGETGAGLRARLPFGLVAAGGCLRPLRRHPGTVWPPSRGRWPKHGSHQHHHERGRRPERLRAQVATASHNIANANTPGYARQDRGPTETIPAEEDRHNSYIGRGVSLQGVVQKRDQFVETQINTAFANSANTSAQADALSTVTALDPQTARRDHRCAREVLFGPARPQSESGDQSLRQAVVDSTQAVAKASMSRRHPCVGQNRHRPKRERTGRQGQWSVDRALRISTARSPWRSTQGGTPNDLLDVRQNDLDQLAQMIGARACSRRPFQCQLGVAWRYLPGERRRCRQVERSVQSARTADTTTLSSPVDGSRR